jgi:Stress responsive A/B Barrel Domain
MVSHVVLMKPRRDLTRDEGRALVAAFDAAVRSIPSVRHVRIGRRVRHGAGYEDGQPDIADYLITIDFDDLQGLEEYLRHPAHEALGSRFSDSLSAAGVYDFQILALDDLQDLI